MVRSHQRVRNGASSLSTRRQPVSADTLSSMLTEPSTAFGVVGALHVVFGVRIPLRDTLFRSLRSHCSYQPEQLSLPRLLHQARAGSVSLFSATFCASETTRSLFIPFCSTDFCGCGFIVCVTAPAPRA